MHIGKDFWLNELKLPGTSSGEDPLHQIVGSRVFKSKPQAIASGKGTSLPWYFNLYRKRTGTEGAEVSSFSPLGKEEATFRVPLRFAAMVGPGDARVVEFLRGTRQSLDLAVRLRGDSALAANDPAA